jgi:hypothetical protein
MYLNNPIKKSGAIWAVRPYNRGALFLERIDFLPLSAQQFCNLPSPPAQGHEKLFSEG